MKAMDNQVIRFGSVSAADLPAAADPIGKEDVTSQTRGAMSQQQLLTAAAKQEPGSKGARIYLSEYHHRYGLACRLFHSQPDRPAPWPAGVTGRRAVGIPLGLAVFVAYYITLTTSRTLGEAGILPLVFGLWLPNFLFALFALLLLWRAYQERPLIPERMQQCSQWLYDRLLKERCRQIANLIHKVILFRHHDADAATVTSPKKLPIHADAATGIFHLPECADYNCPECRLQFKNARIAKEAGFTPCPFCATRLQGGSDDPTGDQRRASDT
jgi:lipopolysaccharide export system permease protein